MSQDLHTPQPDSTTAPSGSRTSRRAASPVIPPGPLPALVTTVLAALLVLTAPLGEVPLTAAVVVLQAVTAAGWFRLNGMWPARQGIALAFLSGLVTDAGLLLTGGEHAPQIVLGTLGVWIVLSLVLHLRNRSDADERLYALTAGLTSTALTVLAAGYLVTPAAQAADGVTAGAAAVAAAVLVRSLPGPAPVVLVLAWAASAAAGWGVAAAGGGLGETGGALLGAAAGLCALLGLRVASYDFPSRFVHFTAGVALPLTLAAPAVHLLG